MSKRERERMSEKTWAEETQCYREKYKTSVCELCGLVHVSVCVCVVWARECVVCISVHMSVLCVCLNVCCVYKCAYESVCVACMSGCVLCV